jgi:hypothetical protein
VSALNVRVFRRDLPGAGFVAIDVATGRSLLGRRRFNGCVVVERRSKPTRGGVAPIIARACADSMEGVIQQLLPSALSNAAIGAVLLRRSAAHAKSRETLTPLQRSPYGRDLRGAAS